VEKAGEFNAEVLLNPFSGLGTSLKVVREKKKSFTFIFGLAHNQVLSYPGFFLSTASDLLVSHSFLACTY